MISPGRAKRSGVYLLLVFSVFSLVTSCSSSGSKELKKGELKKGNDHQFKISSSLKYEVGPERNIAQVAVIDEYELPETLKKLYGFEEKDSIEFEILSYKAAIDARNSAENALLSLDSARALKILHYALRYLPYRSDLKSLKKKALASFLKITKDIGSNQKLECDHFFTRVDFLKVVAPDARVTIITPERCKKESAPIKKTSDYKFVIKNNSLDNDFTYIPTRHPELEEKHKANLGKTLDYYIKRNKSFPYENLIKNSFWFLGEVYGDNQILCEAPMVNPNSTSRKNAKVSFKCFFESEKFDKRPLQFKTEKRYCENIMSELEIPGGETNFYCRQKEPMFSTSKVLMGKFNLMFNEFEFACGMPVYLIAKLELIYKTGKTDKHKFLTHIHHCESDDNHQRGSDKYTSIDFLKYGHIYIKNASEYFSNNSPRICQAGGAGRDGCFFGHSKKDYSSSITLENIDSNQLKGLVGLRLGIDYESSYRAYKDNVRKYAKKRELCQNLLHRESALHNSGMVSSKAGARKLKAIRAQMERIDCYRSTRTYMDEYIKKNWKRYAK